MACTTWNKIISGPNGVFFKLSQTAGLGPKLPPWSELFQIFNEKLPEEEKPCSSWYKQPLPTEIWQKGIQNASVVYQKLLSGESVRLSTGTQLRQYDFVLALQHGFGPLAKALFNHFVEVENGPRSIHDLIEGALLYDPTYFKLLEALPPLAGFNPPRQPGVIIRDELLLKPPQQWVNKPICVSMVQTYAISPNHVIMNYISAVPSLQAVWEAGFCISPGYKYSDWKSTTAKPGIIWLAEKGVIPYFPMAYPEFELRIINKLAEVVQRDELVKNLWEQTQQRTHGCPPFITDLFKEGTNPEFPPKSLICRFFDCPCEIFLPTTRVFLFSVSAPSHHFRISLSRKAWTRTPLKDRTEDKRFFHSMFRENLEIIRPRGIMSLFIIIRCQTSNPTPNPLERMLSRFKWTVYRK